MSIALWTIWVAAVMSVPTVLRLCPMHDAPRAVAASVDAHPGGHADHAPRDAAAHPSHDGRPCHCLGHCSAAAGVPIPSPAVALAFQAVAAPPEPAPPSPRPPLTAPSHLLPFAIGPPAALG